MDTPRPARSGRLRHRHGVDEPVLLPRHRAHRPRQERGDRVPRPDRSRRRDHTHDAQRGRAAAGGRRRRHAAAVSSWTTTLSACSSSCCRRRCGRCTSSPDLVSPRSGPASPVSAWRWRSARWRSRRSERPPAVRSGRRRPCSCCAARRASSRTRSATASTSTCCGGSRCADSLCCWLCSRSRRSSSVGWPSINGRRRSTWSGMLAVLAGVALQDRDEIHVPEPEPS